MGNQGKVIIFSAPSGTGKSTVVNHLIKVFDNLEFSISATTRKPRGNEVNGREYYFLSEEEFSKKLKNNEFLEHEQVYEGLYYGTLWAEVKRIWADGNTVLFDVDVKGGINIKKQFGDNALAVFLKPPSIEVLMERLKKRSTEVEHELQERVNKANYELSFEDKYDIVIVNDVLEDTFRQCEKLVRDFTSRD
ncbi:MAG: guanylate kinase [Bacteroidetes bacterium]|nr:guanylate kinase [Bacteroidota bacterium]